MDLFYLDKLILGFFKAFNAEKFFFITLLGYLVTSVLTASNTPRKVMKK